MPDNIITDATFGQTRDNKEEEPIIVAQRFLNIFRQLHIFSEERKEAFNQMLVELPKPVLTMFKTLPGGTVLLEYLAELEQKRAIDHKAVDELIAKPNKSADAGILKNAVSESQQQSPVTTTRNEIINSDAFAKVLANSLAQSNAQIIRELQHNRQNNNAKSSENQANSGPLKLVADETFTKTIAKALSDALAASEEKRQEDNKVITQSFLELQENLNRMVEQNAQLKIISSGEVPAEAASAFQLKNVVDDLVKAQSKFLRETTKSQKEELSSIISLAIKESLKMSTQSLIESFKQMEKSEGPAPITYASSSPQKQIAMGNVEEAIRAQGREFSSIISSALRESQQNSAQTIIKTLQSLKGSPLNAGASTPNVEEIMKMQASLFRDITQAQNREFSNLIASALKESQKQSTQAIIAALGQMQKSQAAAPAFSPFQSGPVDNDPVYRTTPENDKFYTPVSDNTYTPQISSAAGDYPSLQPESVITPDKDYDLKDIDLPEDIDINIEDVQTTGKKKKKKKKKNQGGDANVSATENETSAINEPQQKSKTIISALPEMPAIEDKPSDSISDWGFSSADDYTPEAEEDSADWEWDYQDENAEAAQSDDVSGTEGEDWEWDYEEVPEGEVIEGEEGQDWEWDYEEVPDDNALSEFEIPETAPTEELSMQDIIANSEIVLPEHFELLLVGMEDDNFQDPYLENSANMG